MAESALRFITDAMEFSAVEHGEDAAADVTLGMAANGDAGGTGVDATTFDLTFDIEPSVTIADERTVGENHPPVIATSNKSPPGQIPLPTDFAELDLDSRGDSIDVAGAADHSSPHQPTFLIDHSTVDNEPFRRIGDEFAAELEAWRIPIDVASRDDEPNAQVSGGQTVAVDPVPNVVKSEHPEQQLHPQLSFSGGNGAPFAPSASMEYLREEFDRLLNRPLPKAEIVVDRAEPALSAMDNSQTEYFNSYSVARDAFQSAQTSYRAAEGPAAVVDTEQRSQDSDDQEQLAVGDGEMCDYDKSFHSHYDASDEDDADLARIHRQLDIGDLTAGPTGIIVDAETEFSRFSGHKVITRLPEDSERKEMLAGLASLRERVRELEAEKRASDARIAQLLESSSSARRQTPTFDSGRQHPSRSVGVGMSPDRHIPTPSDVQNTAAEVALDKLRLENTIETLKSRTAVLERRLEYAEYISKSAEQERDDSWSQLKQLRRELEAQKQENSQQASTIERLRQEIDSVQSQRQPLSSAAELERQPDKITTHSPVVWPNYTQENSNYNNNNNSQSRKAVATNTDDIVAAERLDFSNQQLKREIKEKLKTKFLQERRRRAPKPEQPWTENTSSVARVEHNSQRVQTSSHWHSPVRSRHPPPTFGELPFVVGQSTTPSHSLSANIQQVRHLLKAHDPNSCDRCRSHSRPRSQPRRGRSRSSGRAEVKGRSAGWNSSEQARLDELLDRLAQDYQLLSTQYEHKLRQYKQYNAVETPLASVTDKVEQLRVREELRLLMNRMDAASQQLQEARRFSKVHDIAPAHSRQTRSPHAKSSPLRHQLPGAEYERLRQVKQLQETLKRRESADHQLAFGGGRLNGDGVK